MNRKAFTLIELLVVVAIIGILAAVGVVAYNGYTDSAKRAKSMQQHKDVLKVMTAKWGLCEIQGGEIYWCNGSPRWGTKCDEMKPDGGGNRVNREGCSWATDGGTQKYALHFWHLGYENPYGKNCENCQRNGGNAYGMSTIPWHEAGNLKNFKSVYGFAQPPGQTRIACNGFPNKYACQIRTAISDGEYIYDIITKSSGM